MYSSQGPWEQMEVRRYIGFEFERGMTDKLSMYYNSVSVLYNC